MLFTFQRLIPIMEVMELLTPEMVSEILKITTRQVLQMARQGKIPGIKVGKFWRFSEDSLKDWIQGWGWEQGNQTRQKLDH